MKFAVFLTVFLIVFLTVLTGCVSTATDKYAARQSAKHAASERAKFIKYAYGKCMRNYGIPSRAKLIYGEFISCKKGNNVIFSLKVP